jgi:hypothetical protein
MERAIVDLRKLSANYDFRKISICFLSFIISKTMDLYPKY